MPPIVPNKIDWQWYGEPMSFRRLGNCLKISEENYGHVKSILASNDNIVKKPLSDVILKHDLETTPDRILLSHGLSLRNPRALYDKPWPLPDALPGKWKTRTPEEMEALRKAGETIQGHEGVGYALNYAAKKDINQLVLQYLEGGWTLDHDTKTINDSDHSQSIPVDFPSDAGLVIFGRDPQGEPLTEPGTYSTFGFNNDVLCGSPRSPFTLAIIEAVVKKYAKESDARFGKTSRGNSIYIHQEKRKPKYASLEERNKDVKRVGVAKGNSGIEVDPRWAGTLESSGNYVYMKVLEEQYAQGSGRGKPAPYDLFPRSIRPAPMGIDDAAWSVIPIERRVSHSIDNPTDVGNNIILPLRSKIPAPKEIPYATDDIMELLSAKYS